MGCTCSQKSEEKLDMASGKLPEEDANLEEDKFNVDKKLQNDIIINTDFLAKNQERNNQIFNYFNELRNSPNNFLNEAKKYDLEEFISLAETKKNSIKINKLINNPYFTLYLDNYIQKYPFCKEEIMNGLENDIKLNIYQKDLYSSEGTIDNPINCIWNLIKENKDIMIDKILYKQIDYFLVSSIDIPDTKKVLAYFLLLKKN